MAIFDLKKNLVFTEYGAYHREPTNVAIHVACVPMLLATGFLFGTNTPSIRTPALLSRFNLPLNAGTIASLTYSTLYLLLSPNVAGASVTPFILGMAAFANKVQTKYNNTKVNSIAIGLHVVSWILQFVGHGKYEGRKPALLDNLAQALFLAPLFVWYEILFKLGFYKQLKRDVEAGVEVEIAKLGKRKAKE